MEKNNSRGLLFIVLATLFWAISGNFGSYLFQFKEVRPEHLTMTRMFITGLVLLAYEYKVDKENIFKVFKSKKDFVLIFWFATAGLICMQYGYFASIKYSNAATAVLLQNIAPFFVIIVMSFHYKKVPDRTTLLALFIAFFGTFLLVTHGNIKTLKIAPLALLFGLLAAFGFTNYNIVPVELNQRYSSTYLIGWGMLIAGIVFTIFTRPYKIPFIIDSVSISGILFVSVFGTLGSFVFFLNGSKILGPNKASILSLIEPVASTFIGIFFLGVIFTIMDFIAIGLIISSLLLISLPKKRKDTK